MRGKPKGSKGRTVMVTTPIRIRGRATLILKMYTIRKVLYFDVAK